MTESLTTQNAIKTFIEGQLDQDGLFETGIDGVRLFRASAPVPCTPAVYEPCIIAIVNGSKEAVFDGTRHVYDGRHYLCCPMSMPVQAGTPHASPENPLYGVYIALDPQIMGVLAHALDSAGEVFVGNGAAPPRGIKLAQWDDPFSDALLRLVQLTNNKADSAVLGDARLREVYYAILNGEAGAFSRHAFGMRNPIAQSIAHLSAHLDTPFTIDELAKRAGMSRAAFHRKFKQATAMSPVQFMKSMRLNNAAMNIATGSTITRAANDVGYISTSQFSREFKRLYGQSPRQWSDGQTARLVALG